jgi:hypothetical protein
MHDDDAMREHLWRLATAVRDACYSAGLAAYRDASIDGLCHDGAWECALGAMRSVDFEAVLAGAAAGGRGLPG